MERCDRCDVELPRDEPRYKRLQAVAERRPWWARTAHRKTEALQLCGTCAKALDRDAAVARVTTLRRRAAVVGVLLLGAVLWVMTHPVTNQFKWLSRIFLIPPLALTLLQLRSAEAKLRALF